VGWWIVGIIAGLIVFDLLVHVAFALFAVRIFERKIPFTVNSHPPHPEAERVSFLSTKGIVLRGALYRQAARPARGLIIFCPELEGNHWSALSYCAGLWEGGYDVLAFDFRNQGESDHLSGYDPLHWLTNFEVDDVRAAIRYARERPDLDAAAPLGLVGISRGGGAALAAAAKCPDVRAVACEGAFSTQTLMMHFALRWASLYIPEWVLKPIPSWHIRWTLNVAQLLSQRRRCCRYTKLERLLPRLRDRRILLVAGERDTYVPTEIARSLCRRIGQGAGSATVCLVKGAKHNLARQVDPAAYDKRLVDFFNETAPTPPKVEKLSQAPV
jgi:pimeloyl-ACP methyl ester carboxylesterase